MGGAPPQSELQQSELHVDNIRQSNIVSSGNVGFSRSLLLVRLFSCYILAQNGACWFKTTTTTKQEVR